VPSGKIPGFESSVPEWRTVDNAIHEYIPYNSTTEYPLGQKKGWTIFRDFDYQNLLGGESQGRISLFHQLDPDFPRWPLRYEVTIPKVADNYFINFDDAVEGISKMLGKGDFNVGYPSLGLSDTIPLEAAPSMFKILPPKL